ncbi:MAG: insulinase family protein [Phycisphaerales bacterium]|nr:MAG: insulinase family protein [Phycisphaerales bacterium]
MIESTTHRRLENGIELACATLPHRRAVAIEFRMLAGTVDDPADRLGLARVVEETVAKGTAKRDARAVSDAFDAIGASHSSWTERECLRFTSLTLPEYVDRSIELHAEFLRTATFPQQFVDVAVELGRHELQALDDDPQALADKLVGRQAYGPILGRHPLGEFETLDRITRDDVVTFWRSTFETGRMQVATAGAIEADAAADSLQRHFDGFGSPDSCGRDIRPIEFNAARTHYPKDTQQVQIALGLRGLPKGHPEYFVQRVVLAILSGGMSSRLFTEVREKQGLVYWVSAWGEFPRGAGMLFVGASSRIEHCERAYATIFRELDRLTEDITQEELDRAITQIEVSMVIRGDRTGARCGELADDLFHYGQPVPVEEKLARVRAVTLDDIKRYQSEHPWRPRSIVTLGPKEIEAQSTEC